jgi:ribosomal protein S18 acetylase RimI-like enzyme
MEDIIIRKAESKDLVTLLQFEQGVISAERPFDPTLKAKTNYYDIEQMIASPSVELLVAERNGELIASGYSRIEEEKPYLQHTKHGYLGFMYVLPEHRGRCINKMIIDALAAWTASQGVHELRLDVYHLNEAAIRAYEKVGFVKHMTAMRMPVK